MFDTYSSEKRAEFETCTGINLDVPAFGFEWTNKLVGLQPAIDSARLILNGFETALEPLAGLIATAVSASVELRSTADALKLRYDTEW